MSELTYTALGLGLLGAIFCGVYATNRERLWWAIIPGLSAFTLLAALAADRYIGTDPSNDWASVFVIATGAAIIAGVLRRAEAKRVLAVVAAFAFVIGILMTPLDVAAKSGFLALVVIAAGIVLWSRREHGTRLRPH